jgi:hypothetical protein
MYTDSDQLARIDPKCRSFTPLTSGETFRRTLEEKKTDAVAAGYDPSDLKCHMLTFPGVVEYRCPVTGEVLHRLQKPFNEEKRAAIDEMLEKTRSGSKNLQRVVFKKDRQKWYMYLPKAKSSTGKQLYLGCRDTYEEAASIVLRARNDVSFRDSLRKGLKCGGFQKGNYMGKEKKAIEKDN